MRSLKKRIFDIKADLYETKDLVLAGRQIAFRQLGAGVLDEPVQPYTGLKSIDALLGYDEEASITITQSQPLPMTILGLEYKVSVG